MLPLQQLLIGYQQSSVMTYLDRPSGALFDGPGAIAYDPEPADLASIPLDVVVQQASNNIASVSIYDTDPYLWRDPVSTDDYEQRTQESVTRTFWYYLSSDAQINGKVRKFFVAATPRGTTTGVLRQHAVRFNFTVTCDKGPPSAFPQDCEGERPFEAAYSDPRNLNISVCVPGQSNIRR